MNRLEHALARLDLAVARLEKACAKAGGATAVDSAVAAELSELRRDYAALKGRADKVAERLDASIGRVRRLLGETAG